MRYTKLTMTQKAAIVAAVAAGKMTQAAAAKKYSASACTIKILMRKHRLGLSLQCKRPGPAPTLPEECEANLATWILAMQRESFPVDRAEIMTKVGQICLLLGLPPLTDRWYSRFRGRNSDLVDREAQVIARTRSEVTEDALADLFEVLVKLVVQDKLDATRVFNMDETAFMNRRRNRRVVAARGSTSVHSKSAAVSAHVSIVACTSAAGAVLPLFILLGATLHSDVVKACTIEGASMTTTGKGFINGVVFVQWLRRFSSQVPSTVKRPIVLVCDGLLSHFAHPDLPRVLVDEQIKLVCLPPNATHLV